MSSADAVSGKAAGQEARRQQLVRAAFHQVARRGFEGLRTRDVAAEAGVNIATLHYYFPTKEALIGAVLEHAMSRFQTTLEPHGSPDEQLLTHLRAVRSLLVEEPDLGAVMGELALRSARDESIASIMRSTNQGWHTTVRGLLRRAVHAGRLRAELDTDDVAALITSTLMTMTLPTMAGAPQTEGALRQLERWLGLTQD